LPRCRIPDRFYELWYSLVELMFILLTLHPIIHYYPYPILPQHLSSFCSFFHGFAATELLENGGFNNTAYGKTKLECPLRKSQPHFGEEGRTHRGEEKLRPA